MTLWEAMDDETRAQDRAREAAEEAHYEAQLLAYWDEVASWGAPECLGQDVAP